MRRAIKVAPGSPWANDIIGYSVQSFGMGVEMGAVFPAWKTLRKLNRHWNSEPSNLRKKKLNHAQSHNILLLETEECW